MDDAAAEILNSGPNGPAEAEAPEPTAAPEPAPEAMPPAAEQAPVYGKFGDDPAKVWDAYQNLEREFHARNSQPEPDVAGEPDPEPFEFYVGAQYGVPTNDQELYQWAANNPAEAGKWAVEHRGQIPDEIVNAVENHWAQNDPKGYQQHHFEQYRQEQEQLVSQNLAPVVEHLQKQVVDTGVQMLGQKYADFENYKQAIGQFITQNKALTQDDIQNPGLFAAKLEQIYLQFKGYEWAQQQGGAQAQPAPAADPVGRARVATQSTVSAPAAVTGSDDDIRNGILSA